MHVQNALAGTVDGFLASGRRRARGRKFPAASNEGGARGRRHEFLPRAFVQSGTNTPGRKGVSEDEALLRLVGLGEVERFAGGRSSRRPFAGFTNTECRKLFATRFGDGPSAAGDKRFRPRDEQREGRPWLSKQVWAEVWPLSFLSFSFSLERLWFWGLPAMPAPTIKPQRRDCREKSIAALVEAEQGGKFVRQ